MARWWRSCGRSWTDTSTRGRTRCSALWPTLSSPSTSTSSCWGGCLSGATGTSPPRTSWTPNRNLRARRPRCSSTARWTHTGRTIDPWISSSVGRGTWASSVGTAGTTRISWWRRVRRRRCRRRWRWVRGTARTSVWATARRASTRTRARRLGSSTPAPCTRFGSSASRGRWPSWTRRLAPRSPCCSERGVRTRRRRRRPGGRRSPTRVPTRRWSGCWICRSRIPATRRRRHGSDTKGRRGSCTR